MLLYRRGGGELQRHARAGASRAGFRGEKRGAYAQSDACRVKIPLDESVPQKLRLLIDSRHTVTTTSFQSWSGLNNGALLTAAEESGFELFITADQEIGY